MHSISYHSEAASLKGMPTKGLVLVPAWDIWRARACPPGCSTCTEPRPICGSGSCNWSTTRGYISYVGNFRPMCVLPRITSFCATSHCRQESEVQRVHSGGPQRLVKHPTSESGWACATPSLASLGLLPSKSICRDFISQPSIKGHLD